MMVYAPTVSVPSALSRKNATITPKWFKKIPKSNNNLFAVGTAKSTDYQTSIRKATLIAKADLADRVAGKISDNEKFSNLENYVKQKLVVENRSERK